MHLHGPIILELLTAIIGFTILRFLPLFLKKIGILQYLGEKGLQYLYVILIAYLTAVFVILPISQTIWYAIDQILLTIRG